MLPFYFEGVGCLTRGKNDGRHEFVAQVRGNDHMDTEKLRIRKTLVIAVIKLRLSTWTSDLEHQQTYVSYELPLSCTRRDKFLTTLPREPSTDSSRRSASIS